MYTNKENNMTTDMEITNNMINALINQNIYSSKEAVIKDAIRALLKLKPNLKIEIAISFYKDQKVSLWKAAETAGYCLEEFKEILASRGIVIEID